MTDKISEPAVVAFPLPDDSHVQTFHLERANLRGRIVKVGRVLNDIITAHNHPYPVAKLLSEAVTLTLLLSSMLKYEGTFILQVQGDGPITRIVTDVTSKFEVRGTVGYDAEKVAQLPQNENLSLKDLMGKGYLAFTVDQGEHMERYQGIVELGSESLENSIHHYFSQSEQIRTAITMATELADNGQWRAGAIMLQHMPEHDKIPQDAKPLEENWNRASILLATCKREELLDPRLHDDTLLFRLFHEEGVRVFPSVPLTKGCRCSTEKLINILRTLPESEREHIVVDGKITVNCEFCNKNFDFLPENI